MESFVIVTILAGVIYWAFRSGKRQGSRRGYSVGRRHERRRLGRRRWRKG